MSKKIDPVCDCLVCPCAYPVKRQGDRCPDCIAGNHCSWEDGDRQKVVTLTDGGKAPFKAIRLAVAWIWRDLKINDCP